MGNNEKAERDFAQALVKELHEQHTRLHGKEMGIVPVQLVFAAKHTIEELLRQVTVLETERALREDAAPQPQASAEDVALVDEAVRACIDECGFSGETRDDFEDAWGRIRASLGVSNG